MLKQFLGMERTARDDLMLVVGAVVFAAAYLYLALQIPAVRISGQVGPSAFPIALGMLALVGVAMLIVEVCRRPRAAPTKPVVPNPAVRHGYLVIVAVVAWTALYFMVFERLGYLVASIIYLLGLVGYFHRGSRLVGGIVVVLVCVAIYFTFKEYLGVYLGAGVLPF